MDTELEKEISFIVDCLLNSWTDELESFRWETLALWGEDYWNKIYTEAVRITEELARNLS